MSHIGKYKRSTCRTRIIGALVGIRKWSEWCRQSPIGVATTRRYWFIHPCHQQVSPQMKPCQEPPWSNRDFEPSLLDNHCWTITAESPLLDNHCRPTLLNDIENQNWELAICVRSRGIFGFPFSYPTLHIFLCENWYLPTFINAWLNRRSTVRYICVSRLSLESWSSVSTNKYLKNQETIQNQENIRGGFW